MKERNEKRAEIIANAVIACGITLMVALTIRICWWLLAGVM